MKKRVLILSALIFGASVLISCGEGSKKAEAPAAERVKDQYQCPMKCNEQLFDKPGKCPVCDMELEKVIKS